jgi:polyhydroxybutyrate depolymerase
VVDGRQRELIVAPVRQGGEDGPYDLVVAFHGRTNSNAQARDYFDLEKYAQRPTLFVYPAGLPAGGGARSWTDGGSASSEPRDFALFDAIILRLAQLYCLDLGRVFAVGHSLGASFVNALACARGDRLRGIATVAGGGSLTGTQCSGRVAALLLHNPRDEVVAIGDAATVRDRLMRTNGLPFDSRPGPSSDLGCVRYGGPAASDPIVWCAHHRDVTWRGRYYPHQWPQDAGALIMRFFAELP